MTDVDVLFADPVRLRKRELRFWERVDKAPGHGPAGECWVWTGPVDKDGYGQATGLDGKTDQSNRVSWEIARSPVPEGQVVRHKCDHRCCVRPDHLELGSHAENMQDMVDRGRAASGEENGSRKKKRRKLEAIGERMRAAARSIAPAVPIVLAPLLITKSGPRCGCGDVLARADGVWVCQSGRGCFIANHGPQMQFLGLRCFEAGFGGAAGGGKSQALLVDAVRYVGRGYGGNYAALLLRRKFPDLEKSLIVNSQTYYKSLGGQYNDNKKTWTFPAGERVYFGHLQHEKDVLGYQGTELQYVGFDELTQFTLRQYTYLISRLRSAHGVPLRLRSATNPGGPGHEWVKARFAPWLVPGPGLRAASGEVLRFIRERKEGERESIETRVAKGTPGALGRTFIRSRLVDNPRLANDGVYARSLEELDPVTRAQLRDGDWDIQPAAGLYFKRAWFRFLDEKPATVVGRVRYWDLAASPTGDFAVGARISRTPEGLFVVEDVARLRGTPGEVRAAVRATAELDGPAVPVCLEQDPGQSGKDQMRSYQLDLVGWRVIPCPKRVSKIVAAGPISGQAQAQNVALVKGPWNEQFIGELEAFPDGDHDDQVDALSGAAALVVRYPLGPLVERPPSPPGYEAAFGVAAAGRTTEDERAAAARRRRGDDD